MGLARLVFRSHKSVVGLWATENINAFILNPSNSITRDIPLVHASVLAGSVHEGAQVRADSSAVFEERMDAKAQAFWMQHLYLMRLNFFLPLLPWQKHWHNNWTPSFLF